LRFPLFFRTFAASIRSARGIRLVAKAWDGVGRDTSIYIIRNKKLWDYFPQYSKREGGFLWED